MLGNALGVAGLLLAFVGLSDEALKDWPAIAEHRRLLLVAGIAAAAGSVVLLTISTGSILRDAVRRLYERLRGKKPRLSNDFKATDLSAEQLDLAYTFIAGLMRKEGIERVLDFDRFSEIWHHNSTVYRLLWDLRGKPTIAGFISAFPLTPVSAKAMIDGRLRGRELTSEHIAKKKTIVGTYFIGAIGATSRRARGELIRELNRLAAELLTKRSIPQMLTSPFTPRGRVIAEDFGFIPHLDYGDGELWIRNAPPVPKRSRRKRSERADVPSPPNMQDGI